MSSLFEVVSGQILLSEKSKFFDLHSNVLLPIMKDIGIRPEILLITEIGRHGRFLDIYRYEDMAHYQRLTDALVTHPKINAYYAEIGKCILGSISVELMRELPYAGHWIKRQVESQ